MNDFCQRIAALSPEHRALLERRLQQQQLDTPLVRRSPIPKRSASDPLLLSPAQERLWILHQLEPDLPIYNESILLRLVGSLHPSFLKQSLNQIINRHEVLRTGIQVVEGQPIQTIAATLSISLPVIDLQARSDGEQDPTQQIIREYSSQPFDLADPPLLNGVLIQRHAQEYLLLLTMHHIISDGWSWKVLFQELSTFYQAFCQDSQADLEGLPIQYADVALWQRQRLQTAEFQQQLAYWRQQLQDASPVLELPSDRPRPAVQTFRGARQALSLPSALVSALKFCCQQEQVTVFTLLLAAFKTLLYRYSGKTDILIGTPIANRTHLETERLMGCLINTLVLRTNLADNPRFRELLTRVRQVTLDAQTHQDLPFEQLVQELQPERALTHTPLFQVMVVFQDDLLQTLELPDLTAELLLLESNVAKFDLTLFVEDTRQGLVTILEYNTDLFDATTIARMLRHFQTLLTGIVTDLDQRLSDLPLLTADEQQQLWEWNQTETPYPQDLCIHQLFAAQVERTPDAIALIYQDQQLTYRELNQRANQLAHYLQSLGVHPESLVGICMERSPDLVVGLLGILKAGGGYVPLDPAYPQERLATLLEDAQTSVLLTQQRLRDTLPRHQAKLVCCDADAALIQSYGCQNPAQEVRSGNLAYVIYTSGSTGKPKGVAIEHRSTVALLSWAKTVYAADALAGVLASTSICFDLSVFELFVPLSVGGSVILAENALYLPGLPAAEAVTLINTVPSAIAELLRMGGIPDSVTTINIAGEPLSNQLVQRLYQLPSVQQVFNLYGPSEDTTYSTFALIPKGASSIPPIGRPIANTQVSVLDRHLQPVPIGVPGELYIGGAGLARGYLNQPELTAERFICPSRSDAHGRIYQTGDLVRYCPDGRIEYLGRIDHQIKLRGFRIELGEIEALLMQHAQVQQTVVLVRQDQPDHPWLVAYVVPVVASGSQQNQAAIIHELRTFLQTKLPDYMLPSAFVLLDALPLTPNGKVDRRALPVPDRQQQSIAYIVPQTEMERRIANLWQELLQLEQVGIHDNFFHLGGHSLLLVRLQLQLNQQFQPTLSLVELFKYPTIHLLAQHLSQRSSESTSTQQVHQQVHQRAHQRAQLRSDRRAALRQKRQ